MGVILFAVAIMIRLNLTIVDCKYVSTVIPENLVNRLNLTIVDCKLMIHCQYIFYTFCLNLTIVDCKSARAKCDSAA